MTRLPRSPGSSLVLRLCQETVHDLILLFMLPCGPHLTPLATESLERSLLVFSTPVGLTGDDLSCLFFTCTNTSQAQPAPAILSQESVHTTLSITHHTRERPSTGPRTTHGPHHASPFPDLPATTLVPSPSPVRWSLPPSHCVDQRCRGLWTAHVYV
jgi:hypothetical protein